MDNLKIDFDWEDPRGARGRELRASWARFSVSIGNQIITEVVDHQSRSVRDYIYLPLYPIAEWLVTNWWPLLFEPESPGRGSFADYRKRHNLRCGREGYAFPDLELRPNGRRIHVVWKRTVQEDTRVSFLSEGAAYLEQSAIIKVLTDFIEAVIRRLHDNHLEGTLLEEEWCAVSRCDSEEAAFCKMAATLGEDPYNLPVRRQDEIIDVSSHLPESLCGDFFAAADSELLTGQAEDLRRDLDRIKKSSVELHILKQLRDQLNALPSLCTPWEEGYAYARQLRLKLDLGDHVLNSWGEFEEALKVDSGDLNRAILGGPNGNHVYDALVGPNQRGGPAFIVRKHGVTSKRFAFCRGLFEYLVSPEPAPQLVSLTHTEKQKRNRAFAAEFLAPANLINRRLQNNFITSEQIEDLARAFGVSPLVIQHQISNHNIAALTE